MVSERIHTMGKELTRNSQTCEKQNRENTRKKKKIITRIRQYLVVQQFAYVHGVAGISLLSGKI